MVSAYSGHIGVHFFCLFAHMSVRWLDPGPKRLEDGLLQTSFTVHNSKHVSYHSFHTS